MLIGCCLRGRSCAVEKGATKIRTNYNLNFSNQLTAVSHSVVVSTVDFESTSRRSNRRGRTFFLCNFLAQLPTTNNNSCFAMLSSSWIIYNKGLILINCIVIRKVVILPYTQIVSSKQKHLLSPHYHSTSCASFLLFNTLHPPPALAEDEDVPSRILFTLHGLLEYQPTMMEVRAVMEIRKMLLVHQHRQ